MKQKKFLTCAGAALFGVAMAASAAPPSERIAARMQQQMPAGIEQLRLPTPLSMEVDTAAYIDPALLEAEGSQEVIVRLRSPSVAKYKGRSPSQRMSHKLMLQDEQSYLLLTSPPFLSTAAPASPTTSTTPWKWGKEWRPAPLHPFSSPTTISE